MAETPGAPLPPTPPDPAFAPPRDPLAGAAAERLMLTAGVWQRDIPNLVINTGWTPAGIRAAFHALVAGIFDPPAQLIDSLVGDSRIMAGLDSRIGAVLGRPVDFIIPKKYRDSAAAKECRDAFFEAWPTAAPEPVLSQLKVWSILLGHGHAQQAWDTSGRYAIPHPRVWHPRFTYYDWSARKVMAVTQDGLVPIQDGDGHWIEHAPHGIYRGWYRGALRAVANWWLARNYALTDACSWSDANGHPLIKALHPAGADRGMVQRFCSSLGNRGGHTVVELPQGVPVEGIANGANANFDVAALEFAGRGFEGFFRLIDACNQEINLALQAQTLATSLGPEGRGSYAAARVHADTRQVLVEWDARNDARTIYHGIARPFALMNFDEPDLAPLIRIDVTPYEDAATKATTLLQWTQALVNLKNAGFDLDPQDAQALAKELGLNVGRLRAVEALAVATAQARHGEEPPGAEVDSKRPGARRFAPAGNGRSRPTIAHARRSRDDEEQRLAEHEAWLMSSSQRGAEALALLNDRAQARR